MRLAVAFILTLLPAIAASADDWPQWRGPDRDGVWHETAGVMQVFPAGGLKVVWRARVGSGWSSPIVARGRVYVTDVQIVDRVASERVLCFDQASGKPLWTHRYAAGYPDWALTPEGGGPRATPIVKEGKVYTLGAMGRLVCLDAVKGDVVWEKDLAKEYQVKEFSGITASPLIYDSLLILYMCGKPDACVVAFDKTRARKCGGRWMIRSRTARRSS
jgi:outer membrane protein assembly factor BamB